MECQKFVDNKMELHYENTGEHADDDFNVPMKRVLNILETRECIFSFLSLSTIKTCRLVNHDWNETAEMFLLKSSRISFYNKPGDSKLPEKFISDFSNSSLRNKFDKFCFNNPYSTINFERTLSNFVQKFGSMMKELTITDLQCRPRTYPRICSWMNSPDDQVKKISTLIPFNLAKLNIICKDEMTMSIISADRLKNLHTFRLEGAKVIVELDKNITISPVILQLNDVKMNIRSTFTSFYDGSEQFVNEIFDFRNLQVLELDCSSKIQPYPPLSIDMALDMSGVVNLESLILDYIKIINWEVSKWTVKKLTLGRKMKFVTPTGIKFDELDFNGSMIDIALLPTTLKGLILRDFRARLLNIEFAENLVDLKSLTLCRGEFILFTHFRNCVQLTHLHLDGDIISVDVSVIPKSLRFLRLSFHGFDCNLSGTADFQLETLIIENTDFLKAFQIATSVLKTNNVFFDCCDFNFVTKENVTKKFMADQFRNYIVGPFFQGKRDKLPFYSREDRRVDYLMKTTEHTVVTAKEVGKREIEQLKDAWWLKAL